MKATIYILLIVAYFQQVNCSVTCPTGWTSLATGCYKFVNGGNYQQATTSCENEGGFLVEVNNQEEQDLLWQFHQDSHLHWTSWVWLGATDLAKDGLWMWSHSKQEMTFNAWQSGYPNGGTNTNCLEGMPWKEYKWRDRSCSDKGPKALCEYDMTGSRCSCNGNINWAHEGECRTYDNGKLWCYVNEGVCEDQLKSATPGWFWSYRACKAATTTTPMTKTTTSTVTTSTPATTLSTATSTPTTTTPITAAPEFCRDAGCRDAFDGLGMCVDTSDTDWTTIHKIIDFSAGTKDGQCSKACSCTCFKHIACKNPQCAAKKGICLTPGRKPPTGYIKAFSCDETIDCSCYLKPSPPCKRSKKCKKVKGRCFGKTDTIPPKAKYAGFFCNKKARCKCYKNIKTRPTTFLTTATTPDYWTTATTPDYWTTATTPDYWTTATTTTTPRITIAISSKPPPKPCKPNKKCRKKKGKCYGKFDKVPRKAKYLGFCNKKAGCKCFKKKK